MVVSIVMVVSNGSIGNGLLVFLSRYTANVSAKRKNCQVKFKPLLPMNPPADSLLDDVIQLHASDDFTGIKIDITPISSLVNP